MTISNDDGTSTQYVPVLTIGGEATVSQRSRNFALYRRLKDGDGTGNYKSSGLAGFVYDVPIERLRLSPDGKTFSFLLDKSDECFARLLHVISDHFDTKCEADAQLIHLRRENSEIRRSLIERIVEEND